MTNTEDDNEEVLTEEIIDSIRTAAGKDTLWNTFTERTHSFPNIESMVIQAFVNGDNDKISRRILQKTLFSINLLLNIKDKAIEKDLTFKLSTLNTLLNYQTLVKNNILIFLTKEIKVALNDNESSSITAGLNLPLEHLKLLMTNPKKSTIISFVPDRSEDMPISLQQDKNREITFFSTAYAKGKGVDYRYGDVVCTSEGPWRVDFLIESFRTYKGRMQVRGYKVRYTRTSQYIGIEFAHTDFDVSELPEKNGKKTEP